MVALLLCAAFAFGGDEPDRAALDASLRKAANFLWSQQGEDGGWHSQTYGVLKSGQALTPFALNALLQVPAEVLAVEKERAARGFEFIKQKIDKDGALGCADPALLDYPNYATSLAVRAQARSGRGEWKQEAAPLIACLIRQQFSAERQWPPDHAAFGGFGIGGMLRPPPEPGQVDLSMTRYVLEGLRDAGDAVPAQVFERAWVFLGRCQNFETPHHGLNRREEREKKADGGFFFSPVTVAANKAGHDGKRYRSYGSSTADGVLAMLAAGVPADDPRVKTAVAWLLKHHQAGEVPGIPDDPDTTTRGEGKKWAAGLHFYYLAASAQVFRRLKLEPSAAWRKELAERLLKLQRADGSWANPSVLVKEDDPLIATPLAIVALLNVR